ncbi:hypothetical protein GCM10027321_42360 [Massilia terrae]|uniref:O-antigen ligase family protein n=1 Tax=Massilia terrae TaxID=1811224 RepID=A0ABT2CYJ1_9BURK|nr:O-antigen ligase family protein [Massilia terrae]MCS0659038.1 O-antigen ligase family protein [Massilia terrae]
MMETLLIWMYQALPWMVVALLSLMAVAGIGIGAVWPRFLLYGYLAIFFWMNSTSYGSLAVWATGGVYTRGSGVLLFPLVQWALLAFWLCARLSASYRHWQAPACNLRPWFWGWFLLLCAHLAAASFLNVTMKDALAPSGFSNLVWMGILVSVMLLSFRTRAHAVELGRFIMLAGLGRACFGLARWAFLGGDPNNIYANMNDIHIKLTFFDINDGMVCTAAFAVAAVSLFQVNKRKQGGFWWLAEWATLGATTLCVVLSYRRSAWIGFVLAGLIVMMRFPLKRRIQLAVLGTPVVGAGLLYAGMRRLGQTKGAGHGLSSLVYDMESKRIGPESDRVIELKLALADFLSKPFTGIGSWGRYTGYQMISWQEGPDGGKFLHSGVLHIALKTGLPGLALLAGTIAAFVLGARRAFRTLPPELLPLATAGACGLVFMLPDLLVGTPIPQVRTTQMLAICMALPYVGLGVAHLPATEAAPSARRLNLVPAT